MRKAILVLLLLVGLSGCKAETRAPANNAGSPCYHNAAYELTVEKKLYVNACAISYPFHVERVPIRVEYLLNSTADRATMENYGGLFRAHNMQVSATTTYSHPITYPEHLPFTLIITFTYTGKNRKDIGDRMDCWTEVNIGKPDHEISELQSVLITRDNYNKFPKVTCTFVN